MAKSTEAPPEKKIKFENEDGSETFQTSNGEIYVIHPFDGVNGRRILLRMIDLIKPSPEQMKNPSLMGVSLMSGSSSSFVEKADSIIEDMLGKVFHKPKNAQNNALMDLNHGYCGIHFKKNYFTMVELIIEVILWNDFFAMLEFLPANMIETLMTMIQTVNIEPAKP
jgi:hypothetical protein